MRLLVSIMIFNIPIVVQCDSMRVGVFVFVHCIFVFVHCILVFVYLQHPPCCAMWPNEDGCVMDRWELIGNDLHPQSDDDDDDDYQDDTFWCVITIRGIEMMINEDWWMDEVWHVLHNKGNPYFNHLRDHHHHHQHHHHHHRQQCRGGRCKIIGNCLLDQRPPSCQPPDQKAK